jgi:hypothetical protein
MYDFNKPSETIRAMIALALNFEKTDDTPLTPESLAALKRICHGQYQTTDLEHFADLKSLFTDWSVLRELHPDLPLLPTAQMRAQVDFWLRCLIFRELRHFIERHQYGQDDENLQRFLKDTEDLLKKGYGTLPGVRTLSLSENFEKSFTITAGVFIVAMYATFRFFEVPLFFGKRNVLGEQQALSMLTTIGLPVVAVATAGLCCIKYARAPRVVVVPELTLSAEAQRAAANK